MKSGLVKVGKREVKLSNLDKVLYSEAGFTKGEVVDYYTRIAPVMLGHLKGRPLTLKRYPDGVEAGFFYEKRCPAHRPEWMGTAHVWSESNGEWVDYCVVKELAGLVWVANMASIELHVMLCRMPKRETPTVMVFDFDPGAPAGMVECARAALRMRDLLKGLGLESFAKTSGGKGVHVYVPLNGGSRGVTFEKTKAAARGIAGMLEKEDPKGVTTNMRKDLRVGKVFVDWSQNDGHKTTACAYSLRARTRPTVSTPVEWGELAGVKKERDVKAVTFEAGEVVKRVEKVGDLFGGVLTVKQRLPVV